MKTRLALIVATLQVLVLAFMAGQREWIARTGTPVTLRTAPIDPNDPMRGAYARLDYEINSVPAALCQGATAEWLKKASDYDARSGMRDRVVYATLKTDGHGLSGISSLSDTAPAGGLFLRGRVEYISATAIKVRYGIEALFMDKTAAQSLENMARKERSGAPIDAHVAVGSSGIGVLKGYDWEPLGLTVAFDPPPPRSRPQPRLLTGLTITLHNYGERDLAIVNLPDTRSFRLVANTRAGFAQPGHYLWVGEAGADQPLPGAEDVLVLKPGATHQVHLDLTQPCWWVTDTKRPGSEPMPLSKVTDGWSASFRIEYAPPPADACRSLPHADLIRHTPLSSRAFNASGSLD